MVMAIISAPAIASLRGSAGDSSHTVLTPEALSPPDVGNAAARLKVPPSRNLYRSGWLLISVWGAPESTPAMFFQRRQHYGNDIAHYFDFAPHRRSRLGPTAQVGVTILPAGWVSLSSLFSFSYCSEGYRAPDRFEAPGAELAIASIAHCRSQLWLRHKQ